MINTRRFIEPFSTNERTILKPIKQYLNIIGNHRSKVLWKINRRGLKPLPLLQGNSQQGDSNNKSNHIERQGKGISRFIRRRRFISIIGSTTVATRISIFSGRSRVACRSNRSKWNGLADDIQISLVDIGLQTVEYFLRVGKAGISAGGGSHL